MPLVILFKSPLQNTITIFNQNLFTAEKIEEKQDFFLKEKSFELVVHQSPILQAALITPLFHQIRTLCSGVRYKESPGNTSNKV